MSKEALASAGKGHAHPNYWAIWGWLFVLTVAEIVVAKAPVGPAYPYGAKVLLLVGLALGKAALVALYFMHLRFEKRTLGLIAMTPLFLCVFLLFMLFPDSIPY